MEDMEAELLCLKAKPSDKYVNTDHKMIKDIIEFMFIVNYNMIGVLTIQNLFFISHMKWNFFKRAYSWIDLGFLGVNFIIRFQELH